jgi:hypothetical protein
VKRFSPSRESFNANIALARRGSAHVRLDLLRVMLDESALSENFRLRTKDGRDLPDEEVIANTLDATLRAIDALHRLRPQLDLSGLRENLNALAKSPNMALRVEAERTLTTLGL